MLQHFIFSSEEIEGLEHLPDDGAPTLFVSNHQNGLMDPLLVVCTLTDRKVNVFTRGGVFSKGKWINLWFKANHDYQLVFMDIQVADGIVFDLFDAVEINCPVIFTTAYDQYAIKAFKVNSIDYLLKPVSNDDLAQAMDKLRRLENNQTSPHELELRKKLMEDMKLQLQGGARCFLSVSGSQLIPVSTDETAYYIVDKHTLLAVDYQNKRYRLDFTMDELASKLDPTKFYRANRQYMVAHKAIKEIYLGFGGKLELRLAVPIHQHVVISRTKVKEFKLWYAGIPSAL